MKNPFSKVWTLIVALGFSATAFAAVSGPWTYALNSLDEVILSACDPKTKGEVVVPSTIDGHPVVTLERTFRKCKKITSVVIPPSVAFVGNETFAKCEKLKSVVFEDYSYGVRFGTRVFDDAAKVKSLTLPLGATFVDDFLVGSSVAELEILEDMPGSGIANLDAALTAKNSKGNLGVAVKRLIVPHKAIASDWFAALPGFFSLKKRTLGIQHPRAWVVSVAEGGGYLKYGGKKYIGTVAVPKGKKVSFVATGASGYTPQDVVVDVDGVISTYPLANSRTVTMGNDDVTFSASYVKTVDERAKLDVVADGLKLSTTDCTINAVPCARGWIGEVLSKKLVGLEQVLSKTTCTFTGLPKGLALKKHGDGFYYLEGVPASAVDFKAAPVYVTLKSLSGHLRVIRLNLTIPSRNYSPSPTSFYSVCSSSSIGAVVLDSSFIGFLPASLLPGFSYDPSLRKLVCQVSTQNVGLRTIAFQRSAVDPATGKSVVEKRYVRVDVNDRYLYDFASDAPFQAVSSYSSLFVNSSVAYDFSAAFANADAGTPSLAGLPAGVKFDKTNKRVTGKVTKTGIFNLTLAKKVGGILRQHVVKWEVKAKDWAGAGLVAAVNPSASAQIEKNGVITMLAGMSFSKSNGSYTFSCSEKKATVKASGLPKGLSLVKTASGEFVIAGRATATGKKVVTVTAKANGVTKTERIAYDVIANPLKGSYRGDISTPRVGAGAVSMSVAASGLATLSITEGKTTTKVTAYPKFRSGYTWDSSKPTVGDFTIDFPIKANKTLKTKARTVKVGYKSLLLNGVVQVRCGPQSAFSLETDDGVHSKGSADGFTCYPALAGAALTAHPFYKSSYRCDATTFTYDVDSSSGWHERFLSTVKFDWTSGKAKVYVRLPLGKTYSATLPVVADFHASEAWAFTSEPTWRAVIVAPVVATDADGTVYSLLLPGDPTEKDTGWKGLDEVYNGATRKPWFIQVCSKSDLWMPNYYAEAAKARCFGVRTGKTFEPDPATYVGLVPIICGENGSLGDWFVDQSAKLDGGGNLVVGVTPYSYSYNPATGLFRVTFRADLVSGPATCFFEGVPVTTDGRNVPTEFRGVMSCKKGTKTTWGIGALQK